MLLLSQILNLQANSTSAELTAFSKAFDAMMATFLSKTYTASILEQEFNKMENIFRDVVKSASLNQEALLISGGTMGATTISISSEEPAPVPANAFELAQLFQQKSKEPCTTVSLFDFNTQLVKVTHKAGEGCIPSSIKIKFDNVGEYLEFYANVVVEKYIADLQNLWSNVFSSWNQNFFESTVAHRDGKIRFDSRSYLLKEDVQSGHVYSVVRAATIMILRTEAMIAHNLVPTALT